MLEKNPLWYKDAIIYEVHVRAFHDHIGDGMGDFRGLTQKLDYLQDLGITVVWLLPFYPSPLRDDGYDIADYMNIHPHYGTLRDFKEFLSAAHQRGIRVITELVINHTSDQHPWFARARRAPAGSPERDFYVWSDTPKKYQEARIIFKDFEHSNWTWDPVANAYYWHRFYSHQPDLNYDNPAVWEAIFPVVDFWLELGVDGMRLDAVPYLFEREGTCCENLPETHTFLKALRQHVDSKFADRMLLAEANQWPEDASAYFGHGDECHMAFHFPLMPRMFMAIHMEDSYPILDILAQTPALPESCQWGVFLRNHDELTLEMVTDEERDYMYRAYAGDQQARINLGIRHRLAPLLGNNRRRIELMHGLLFSLPGTPILYYGDEIGMGDNIYLGDRNGVRTPMQWSADRNAGFSRANAQKLYLPVIVDPEYHYEAVNVEAQQNNPSSLLWWTKRLIALRKHFMAFGRGSLELLQPNNNKVLAFLRRYQDETILVVANLSRFVQHFDLDLTAFQGMVPVELFSRNPFPRVGKLPYSFIIGPHSFYWFGLESRESNGSSYLPRKSRQQLPEVSVDHDWQEVCHPPARCQLEEALPGYLQRCRWFGGMPHIVKRATIRESFRLRYGAAAALVILVEVAFEGGAPEVYLLPLAFAPDNQPNRLLEDAPQATIVHIHGGAEGVLFDALVDPGFATALLEAMAGGKSYSVSGGEIVTEAFPGFREARGPEGLPLPPSPQTTRQHYSSINYGDRMILKVYRRLEEGTNPELEIGRYLTQKRPFPNAAPVLGAIEYRRRRGEPTTLAVLQGMVPHQANAWQYTLDELSRFFERVLALPFRERSAPAVAGSLLELTGREVPSAVKEFISSYFATAQFLGRRTGELHLALAAEAEDRNFAPEAFSTLYQRSLYQSMRNLRWKVLDQLRRCLPELPDVIRTDAAKVLDREDDVLARFRSIITLKVNALRIRHHGDLHLGQVLYTGKDFVFIDFEGDPARSIGDRRVKRAPLRDVVGMVRSFHYAAYACLLSRGGGRNQPSGMIRPVDLAVLEPWARFWYVWVSAAFVKTYLDTTGQGNLVPASLDEVRVLFEAFLLEKALYELGYELDHRPDWVRIPLWGILQLLEADGHSPRDVKPETAAPEPAPIIPSPVQAADGHDQPWEAASATAGMRRG